MLVYFWSVNDWMSERKSETFDKGKKSSYRQNIMIQFNNFLFIYIGIINWWMVCLFYYAFFALPRLSLNVYTFPTKSSHFRYLLIRIQFAMIWIRNCIKQRNQQKPNHHNQHFKTFNLANGASRANDCFFFQSIFVKIERQRLWAFSYSAFSSFLSFSSLLIRQPFLCLHQICVYQKCDNDFVIKGHKLMF